MCDNDSLVESQVVIGPNPIFLGQQILFGLIGILTNTYSLCHMLKKFNLSKINYKLLMVACIINIVQFVAEVLAAIWLLLAPNEIGCIIMQISLMGPKFVIQCYILEICIARCISMYKKNYTSFQKSFIYFVSPLPFGYIATFFIVRLGQQKPVGLLHLVSF